MPELEFCRNCCVYLNDDLPACANCNAPRTNTIKGQFNQEDADVMEQGGTQSYEEGDIP
jgi:hypothetical protein